VVNSIIAALPTCFEKAIHLSESLHTVRSNELIQIQDCFHRSNCKHSAKINKRWWSYLALHHGKAGLLYFRGVLGTVQQHRSSEQRHDRYESEAVRDKITVFPMGSDVKSW